LQRRADFGRIRLALARSAHFKQLNAVALDRLAGLGRLRHARNGERLPADNQRLWIVVDGAVRLTARLAHRQKVHAVLGRGSYFGLAAALGEGAFPLDVHAAGPTDVAVIDGARLRGILQAHPSLWRYVAALAYGRLRLALGVMEDNRLRPLVERVIRRLLGHASSYAIVEGEQPELRMTQADLAGMVDAGRSRINVALGQLAADGLIRAGYRTITLLDLPRLRSLAGGEVEAF
jgi:CRP/FNR family transcriptional regulator